MSYSSYMFPMLSLVELSFRSAERSWGLATTAEAMAWFIGFPTLFTLPTCHKGPNKGPHSLTTRTLLVLTKVVACTGRTVPVTWLKYWLHSRLGDMMIKLSIAGLTVFGQPRFVCILLRILSSSTGALNLSC